VRKKHWANMTASIQEAKVQLREMIQRRSRGRGDQENSMRQIEHEFGIGYWQQFQLLYRQGSRETIERVRQAYLMQLAQSVRRDMAKLEIEAAKQNETGDADVAGLAAEDQNLLARIKARVGT
jgi:hypothetical protein